MGHSNGIITKPIDVVDDIMTVLGEKSTDLGTLCTSDKIIMWAKYKPEDINQLEPPTESQRKSNNYGLAWLSWSTPSLMANNVANFGWTYKKPTKFFRQDDFAGYNHNATSFLPYLESPQTVYTRNTTTVCNISLNMPRISTDEDRLTLADLSIADTPLSRFYFGVILKKGSETIILTQGTAGLSSTLEIDFPTPLPSGSYSAWLFASSVPVLKNQSNRAGNYIGLNVPQASTMIFTAYTDPYSISVKGVIAYNSDGSRRIEYTITLFTQSAMTFHNVNVTIYANSSSGTQVGYALVGDVSLSNAQTRTITGSINVTNGDIFGNTYYSYYIQAKSNEKVSSIVSCLLPIESF